MNTRTDEEVLADLDFEVSEEQAKACCGFVAKAPSGAITNYKTRCSNPAVVVAVWSCCGKKSSFCLDCYNAICEFAANHKAGVLHQTCNNLIKRPFTDTSFL